MDLLYVSPLPGRCVISWSVCYKGNSAYPYQFSAFFECMTSFVDLAKGGKSFGDIKKLVDDVQGQGPQEDPDLQDFEAS